MLDIVRKLDGLAPYTIPFLAPLLSYRSWHWLQVDSSVRDYLRRSERIAERALADQRRQLDREVRQVRRQEASSVQTGEGVG